MSQFLRTVIALTVLLSAVSAQQPPPVIPPPSPSSRLQEMEEIYQKELSARHIPLLGKYLVELQRQSAAVTDKSAYQAEIARIQQIISVGGAVDLIAAQQAQAGTLPMPAPDAVPAERKQALIALAPALAQTLLPPAAPNSATAPLGEGEWRIELIAAGTYDILLHYACPELSEPLPVRVEFGGQVVQKIFDTDRATKDAQTFRIVRLGTLTLTGDHRGETLHLIAGDKAAPKLIFKSLLVTKPRPPAN